MCLIDGLEHCHNGDYAAGNRLRSAPNLDGTLRSPNLDGTLRSDFIGNLLYWDKHREDSTTTTRLKFFLTCSPFDDLSLGYQKLTEGFNERWINGQDSEHRKAIHDDVCSVARHEIATFDLPATSKEVLEAVLIRAQDISPAFLWMTVVLENLRFNFRNASVKRLTTYIEQALPHTLRDAYANILKDHKNPIAARLLLTIVAGARRALTVSELKMALHLADPWLYEDFHISEMDTDELERKIREWCGPLIIITYDKVHLIHPSARLFLLSGFSFPDLDMVPPISIHSNYRTIQCCPVTHDEFFSVICVAYLTSNEVKACAEVAFRDFIQWPTFRSMRPGADGPSFTEITERLSHLGFLRYAAANWQFHALGLDIRKNEGKPSRELWHIEANVRKMSERLLDVNDLLFWTWFSSFWQESFPEWTMREAFHTWIYATSGVIDVSVHVNKLLPKEWQSDPINPNQMTLKPLSWQAPKEGSPGLQMCFSFCDKTGQRAPSPVHEDSL